MLGLVVFWVKNPNAVCLKRDGGRTDAAYFSRPCSARQLELHHRGNSWGEVCQRVTDDALGDRLDRFGFSRLSSSAFQTSHSHQCGVNLGRYVFVLHRPAKHPLDATDQLVDVRSAVVRLDHRVPNLLQPLGAKFACRAFPVEIDNRPQRTPNGIHFIRRLAVFAVVLLGVLHKENAQVIDGERVPADVAVLGKPLGDQVVVRARLSGVPYSPR